MARVAVIGGGWAGLACAQGLLNAGHQPTVFEAAPQLGGRARSLPDAIRKREGFHLDVDNGQHLLLGAYSTLATWMEQRELKRDDYFLRTPMQWTVTPPPLQLRMPRLPAPWQGLIALLGARGWPGRTRLRVLKGLRQLQQRRWQCPPHWSWQHCLDVLKQDPLSRNTWWYPLCVAVSNTPPEHCQAQGLLTVLKTVLEGAPHFSDWWLPKQGLSTLLDALVDPRIDLRLRHPIRTLVRHNTGFEVAGEPFTALALAAPPAYSSQLLAQLGLLASDARWPHMPFHAITTCYLKLAAAYQLPTPMMAVLGDPGTTEHDYWVFDRSTLAGQPLEQAELAVVVSHGQPYSAALNSQTVANTCWQRLAQQLGPTLPPLQQAFVVNDKRATFAFTPDLERPGSQTADPRVVLAGDWVAGPFPATLEGAVRAGFEAARQLSATLR